MLILLNNKKIYIFYKFIFIKPLFSFFKKNCTHDILVRKISWRNIHTSKSGWYGSWCGDWSMISLKNYKSDMFWQDHISSDMFWHGHISWVWIEHIAICWVWNERFPVYYIILFYFFFVSRTVYMITKYKKTQM